MKERALLSPHMRFEKGKVVVNKDIMADNFVFRSLTEFEKPDYISLEAASVHPTEERLLRTDPTLLDRLKKRDTERARGKKDILWNLYKSFSV